MKGKCGNRRTYPPPPLGNNEFYETKYDTGGGGRVGPGHPSPVPAPPRGPEHDLHFSDYDDAQSHKSSSQSYSNSGSGSHSHSDSSKQRDAMHVENNRLKDNHDRGGVSDKLQGRYTRGYDYPPELQPQERRMDRDEFDQRMMDRVDQNFDQGRGRPPPSGSNYLPPKRSTSQRKGGKGESR